MSDRLPDTVEAAAYYVVSEALANMVKHAHADAATRPRRAHRRRALVDVADNGEGGADPDLGSGLSRPPRPGGDAERPPVVESASGQGTRIRADLPVRLGHPARSRQR